LIISQDKFKIISSERAVLRYPRTGFSRPRPRSQVPIVLSKPGVDGLSEAARVLREWQYDGAPMQLHPGDLGWHWRFGAEATAAAVRTWSRDGHILAVGLVDSPGLVRLAIVPEAQHDEELAYQMVADVTQPERGVLPQGSVSVEARLGGLFQRAARSLE
jgi:hypothetical protein